jgi:two-component system chemotaxis response regulator CheY
MKRILVIDDAATVRMYHRQVLETAGYQVDEAVNGYEGLEKAVTTEYALLIVDINMPVMDGYTMLSKLRSDYGQIATPAIMVSTEEKASDNEKAFAVGANFYVIKPAKPEELLVAVRMLIGMEN